MDTLPKSEDPYVILNEYDQKMPQSQTTDQLMAP